MEVRCICMSTVRHMWINLNPECTTNSYTTGYCRSEAGFSRYAYVCLATTALLASRPVESTDSPRRIMESPPGMRHREYIKAALHPSQGPTLIPFGFGTVPYLCQYNIGFDCDLAKSLCSSFMH